MILKKISKAYDIFKYFGTICLLKSLLSYIGLYKKRKTQYKRRKITIFIISYNRVECLKKLISFLRKRDLMQQVIIIDNNSTYPPLLDYLKTLECRVEYLNINYGHLVLWKCHLFDYIISKEAFVLTDSDVIPNNNIPKDFLNVMLNKLEEQPDITKIGLSLLLDDIPESNKRKKEILNWEKRFWKKRMDSDKTLFEAQIDTTFAVYRPNIYPYLKQWYKGARMDKPYFARHLGWYLDSNNPTEEDLYYASNIKKGSSHWFGQ